MTFSAESTFIPIDVNIVKYELINNFEVFSRSGEGRMLLYCSEGKIRDEFLYEKVLDKKIVNLYIYRKDRHLYDRYVESILSSIISDENISLPQKGKIIYNSISSAMKTLFESQKPETIQRLKKITADTVDFVFKDEQAIQYLISMTSFDYTPSNHSVNVGIFGTGLLKELMRNIPNNNAKDIAPGFFLHDIGKAIIPIDILNKKGALSPVEWKLIRRHPEEGYKILEKNRSLTKEIEIIVSQHHERENGSGYPNGLRGKNIHLYSKICAIADVFDGLTSYRPYRKESSSFEALGIMRKELAKDFDAAIFSRFVQLFKK